MSSGSGIFAVLRTRSAPERRSRFIHAAQAAAHN